MAESIQPLLDRMRPWVEHLKAWLLEKPSRRAVVVAMLVALALVATAAAFSSINLQSSTSPMDVSSISRDADDSNPVSTSDTADAAEPGDGEKTDSSDALALSAHEPSPEASLPLAQSPVLSRSLTTARSASRSVPAAPTPTRSPSQSPVTVINGVSIPRLISDMPCPKVFVYYETLPHFGSEIAPDDIPAGIALGLRQGETSLYDRTSHHELVHYFLYRLKRSTHCKLTRDPKEADLFFIPAMPGRKSSAEWRDVCTSSAVINARTASQHVPHLSLETATRHFALVSNGLNHIAVGGACAWLRGEEALFAPIQRFSYTSTFVATDFEVKDWKMPGPVQLDGQFLSVPVLSSVHWSAGSDRPWAEAKARPLLMYFVGGFHGPHEDIRRKIVSQCKRMGQTWCRADTTFSIESLHMKRSAVFCLEPDGDSPWRKSYFDSINNGCIPVFFSATVDATCPWHWGPRSFHDNTRVLFPIESFRKGTLTLSFLRQISPERIAEMQSAIRTYGHRLQYAAEDYPTGDDAFEILLKKAHLRAQGVPWDALREL
jgi:hypothetical protein